MYVCITTLRWKIIYFQCLDDRFSVFFSTFIYISLLKSRGVFSWPFLSFYFFPPMPQDLVLLGTQTKSHSSSKFLFYVYVCPFDSKSASPYRIKISFCAWKLCPPSASEQSLPTSKSGPWTLRYIYSFVEAILSLAKVKSLSASNMTTTVFSWGQIWWIKWYEWSPPWGAINHSFLFAL